MPGLLLTNAFAVENPKPARFTTVTRIVFATILLSRLLSHFQTFCPFNELGICSSSDFVCVVVKIVKLEKKFVYRDDRMESSKVKNNQEQIIENHDLNVHAVGAARSIKDPRRKYHVRSPLGPLYLRTYIYTWHAGELLSVGRG
jgi:hypothetical protein